jgi:hypothetical protein
VGPAADAISGDAAAAAARRGVVFAGARAGAVDDAARAGAASLSRTGAACTSPARVVVGDVAAAGAA